MGIVFAVLLLTGSRLMKSKQVHYLVGLLERFARKDLYAACCSKSQDEFSDIAKGRSPLRRNLKGGVRHPARRLQGAQRHHLLPGELCAWMKPTGR